MLRPATHAATSRGNDDIAAEPRVHAGAGASHVRAVSQPPTLGLRAAALFPLLTACDHAPSPAEIVDRGWRAHELVVAAGEHAPSCAAAGIAMETTFAAHRQAFV